MIAAGTVSSEAPIDLAWACIALRSAFFCVVSSMMRSPLRWSGIDTATEAATVFDAGDRIEATLHQRRQAADSAGAVGHRRVHRQHRRRLGDAIAFENADAVALHEHLPRAVLDRFGAGDHQTQGAEIIRM